MSRRGRPGPPLARPPAAADDEALIGLEGMDVLVVDAQAVEAAGTSPGIEEIARDAHGNRIHSRGSAAEPQAPDAAPERETAEPLAAQELCARHGLSPRLAELVAARKLTLRTALAMQAKQLQPRPVQVAMCAAAQPTPRTGARLFAMALVAAGAASAAWMLLEMQRELSPPQAARTVEVADAPVAAVAARPVVPAQPRGPEPMYAMQSAATVKTDVRLDEVGRPVRVAGPTPQAVLLSYCHVSGACRMSAELEIASNGSDEAGVRFGLYTDEGDGATPWAVPIHRESGSGAWVAGDGRRPVAVFDAAKLVFGTERLRVDTSGG